jgi:hypothetical protein
MDFADAQVARAVAENTCFASPSFVPHSAS